MPGPLWKANVQQLDQRFDVVRERLDRLNSVEKADNKFKVYNNGNTMVEVSIKTKKPGKADTWNSILSQDEAEKPKKKYTQATASSKAKSKAKSSPQKVAKTAFPLRTLQVFLQEMRSALKTEASSALTAHKILDDLDYVAANLNLGSDQFNRLKSEHEGHQAEVKDLRTQLSKLNKQFANYELDNAQKDQKIADCKSVISRLTTNNNDMLALLTNKADVEESLKLAQSSISKLTKQLSQEQNMRFQAEQKLIKAQQETALLSEVIS